MKKFMFMLLAALLGKSAGAQPPKKPTAPNNLTAIAISTTQINLQWNDRSNNETGFRIERCQGASCTNYTLVANVGANVTTYSDTGLTADTTYRYRVRAFNGSQNSAWSNIANATTQTDPDPPPPSGPGPKIGGVQIFPSNNIWNTPINTLPVQRPVDVINDHGGHNFHPDFGDVYNGRFNGMPVNVVAGSTITPVRVNIGSYADESDVLPGGTQNTGFLPIPTNVKIEGDPVDPVDPEVGQDPGADNHLLLIDSETQILHELYNAQRQPDGTINAAQYSRWDLNGNVLRPDGWTSTDAAGLPVAPGLILYDQVAACLSIDPQGTSCDLGHAVRFTLDLTHGPHIWPARHDANSGDVQHPPFGLRVRLKSSFDTSGYSPINRVILNTLKKYGAMLADNGGDWFFQGAPDPRWSNDDLALLKQIVPATSFEVVDVSPFILSYDSAEIDPTMSGPPGGNPTPAPTLNFSASPTSIQAGQSSTLTWSSTDATSCTASGGWSGNKALSGSEVVTPTASTNYGLLCIGAGGSVSKSTFVAVSTGPGGSGTLSLTDTGTGFDRKVTVDSIGLFRLVFDAGDNWGLSEWYDLVHDPSATKNLAGPGLGVNQNEPSLAEPGLYQQVFYGTTPNDPKLYTRAMQYFFPGSAGTFDILEVTPEKIVVRASGQHPVAGSLGVLSNVTVSVTYQIFPNGKILIHSETNFAGTQAITDWKNAVMGLQDPGHDGSVPPDTRGWIRATATQNPYDWTGVPERYVFSYWSPNTPAPYTDFSKASILLVPNPNNDVQGWRFVHSWTNWMRWGFGTENVTFPAGTTVILDYYMQLGTQGSQVLPDIRTIATADALADAYLGQ